VRFLKDSLARSIVVSLVVCLFALLADLVLGREGISRADLMVLGDLLAGAAFGLVYWFYARREEERRREIERRLALAAEMNHHIRNALQTIIYAHYLNPSPYAEAVQQSIDRIKWALNEVLTAEVATPLSNPSNLPRQ
jgi:hypothetical protein